MNDVRRYKAIMILFPYSEMGLLNTAPTNEFVDSSPSTIKISIKKTFFEKEPTYFSPSRIAPATHVTFSSAFFLVAWFGMTAAKTVINPLGLPI